MNTTELAISKPKFLRIPNQVWFAVVVVLMLVLSFFLQIWLPYHREQAAIREIERVGGSVTTRWSGPEWVKDGPDWVREIGKRGWLSWFDRVKTVYLAKTTVSDEDLKHLSSLNNLSSLNLNNTQVSDKGLKHLSSLNNLVNLDLDNTQVSYEGLKHLSSLNNLHSLYIKNTQISDEDVKELGKALGNCSITPYPSPVNAP